MQDVIQVFEIHKWTYSVHLLEQKDHEINASKIHNQVADQMSKSGSNGDMKHTPQDDFCKEPAKQHAK